MRFQGIVPRVIVILCFVLSCSFTSLAKDGKIKIKSSPKQAYLFVDDQAFGEANYRAFEISPGEHKISVYNYGYKPSTQTVTIVEGKTTKLEVTLERIPGEVTGPRGCITIEGPGRFAVLLNGKSPEYLVGHVDEFNHEWSWKQELIVPPGTHELTIMRVGQPTWSGKVEVPANERVVVGVYKGVKKTVPWSRGEKLAAMERFQAAHASASVLVVKPTVEFASSTPQIDCGDSAQLKWSSTDAVHAEISPVGVVAPIGEQQVQPRQATTYQLTASGPGGTATASTTVGINPMSAELIASPNEIRYRKVGDKVLEQGSATLKWTSSNANSLSIDSVGSVSKDGTQVIAVKPQKTAAGPVDETITYTLAAANECGAAETKTATVHLVGSIEPMPELNVRSVYFPTNLPKSTDKREGLLASQQTGLLLVADRFKKYLEYNPDATIQLDGHADKRGARSYNQDLSERRAEQAKQFLIENGVPAEKISTRGHGFEQNLSMNEVKQLVAQSPDLTATEQQEVLLKSQTLVYANNRRVDISLNTGEMSAKQYPFKADDFSALLRRGPEAPSTEMAQGK